MDGPHGSDLVHTLSLPVVDFYHATWECPALRPFWKGVGSEISMVPAHPIDLSPRVALLDFLEELAGPQAKRIFIGMACLVAKRDITHHWKQPTPPVLTAWRKRVNWCAYQGTPIYQARDAPKNMTNYGEVVDLSWVACLM
ncbi:hypothetical protein NDU88_004758 [Pleurodeles waltl]|uniref:Uncharacterized protein n=1 Tax=Pleurodeles waltl TaxID=8319 RepID=A0AAV7TA19_PLEWA|nr:hypothetical protein NDU88_004758 [Pleurodeles waltl]